MATAIERVFTTPELLEAILLEVGDMRTLLLSQRVDRTFKATIDSSILLQRALWFKPMPPEHSHSQDDCPSNPLIRKHRTTPSGRRVPCISGWFLTDDEYPNLDIEKAPVIVLIPRQEGSWRKMFLFQPGEFPEFWIVALPHRNEVSGGVWMLMAFSTDEKTVPFKCGFLNFGKRSDAAKMGKILDDVTTYTARLMQKIDGDSPLIEWCWIVEEEQESGPFKTWYAPMNNGQHLCRVAKNT